MRQPEESERHYRWLPKVTEGVLEEDAFLSRCRVEAVAELIKQRGHLERVKLFFVDDFSR